MFVLALHLTKQVIFYVHNTVGLTNTNNSAHSTNSKNDQLPHI